MTSQTDEELLADLGVEVEKEIKPASAKSKSALSLALRIFKGLSKRMASHHVMVRKGTYLSGYMPLG